MLVAFPRLQSSALRLALPRAEWMPRAAYEPGQVPPLAAYLAACLLPPCCLRRAGVCPKLVLAAWTLSLRHLPTQTPAETYANAEAASSDAPAASHDAIRTLSWLMGGYR